MYRNPVAISTTATVTTDAAGKVEAEVNLPAKAVAEVQEKGEAVPLPIPEVKATRAQVAQMLKNFIEK